VRNPLPETACPINIVDGDLLGVDVGQKLNLSLKNLTLQSCHPGQPSQGPVFGVAKSTAIKSQGGKSGGRAVKAVGGATRGRLAGTMAIEIDGLGQATGISPPFLSMIGRGVPENHN
jgi:hypothetical protein